MNQRTPFPMDQGQTFFRVGGMHRGGGDVLDWVIFALLLLLVLLVVAQLVLSVMRRPRFGGPPWGPGGGGGGGRHGGPPWRGPDALAIAQARYARGELDRDAYLQLAEDLGGAPAPPPPA